MSFSIRAQGSGGPKLASAVGRVCHLVLIPKSLLLFIKREERVWYGFKSEGFQHMAFEMYLGDPGCLGGQFRNVSLGLLGEVGVVVVCTGVTRVWRVKIMKWRFLRVGTKS